MAIILDAFNSIVAKMASKNKGRTLSGQTSMEWATGDSARVLACEQFGMKPAIKNLYAAGIEAHVCQAGLGEVPRDTVLKIFDRMAALVDLEAFHQTSLDVSSRDLTIGQGVSFIDSPRHSNLIQRIDGAHTEERVMDVRIAPLEMQGMRLLTSMPGFGQANLLEFATLGVLYHHYRVHNGLEIGMDLYPIMAEPISNMPTAQGPFTLAAAKKTLEQKGFGGLGEAMGKDPSLRQAVIKIVRATRPGRLGKG